MKKALKPAKGKREIKATVAFEASKPIARFEARTRIRSVAILVLIAAGLGLGVAPASEAGTPGQPPDNDDFDDAFGLLAQFGSVSGTINAATKEPGEPDHAGNDGGASVWYLYYSGTDQSIVFDTEGSEIDTVMGVYQGDSVSNLDTVASSDDAVAGQGWSGVQFDAQEGQFYFIAVDGFNDGSTPQRGNIELNFGEAAPYQTTITQKPPKVLKGEKRVRAKVAFKAFDDDAKFQCSLDAGPFKGCASPKVYRIKTTKQPKARTIQVRAVDPYGNVDPTPAKATFKVKRKRAGS